MAQKFTKEKIAKIYFEHQRSLITLALTYMDSIQLAEELVADAMVAIFEPTLEFTSEPSCVCYFRKVIRSKAINYFRRKYKIEAYDEEDIEKGFIQMNLHELPFGDVEVQLLLDGLLKKYPDDIRAAFIAHVLDQEPISALAALYGMKADSLKKQISRMKKYIVSTIPEKDMRTFLYLLMLMP